MHVLLSNVVMMALASTAERTVWKETALEAKVAEYFASVNAAGLELFQNFFRAAGFVARSAIRVALVMRGKKCMGNSLFRAGHAPICNLSLEI